MTTAEPVYRHRLRVRYAETDAGGVAHHSSYAAWFEEARTEWLRAEGTTYREIEASGFYLMVTEMRCLYRSSARYDDELEILVRKGLRKRASIEIEYEVREVSRDRLVALAMTRLTCTDREGKVRRLPAVF